MNLDTDSLLELARKVTGQEWIIVTYPNGGGIGYVVLKSDPDNVLWKPSLDANAKDWQLAQACRVIVAASSMDGFSYTKHKGLNSDILTAAAQAILRG